MHRTVGAGAAVRVPAAVSGDPRADDAGARDLARTFLDRSRHLLGVEYPTKLHRCLDVLAPEALWLRPAEGTNSIGNLLLHLAGNVRQWIAGGVAGRPAERDRAAEFAATGGVDAAALRERLDAVVREADAILASLSAGALLERRTIQGRETTVLEAIYHVVEHFGMHTGQIILLTKILAPGTIRFYEDAGGLARPLWPRPGAQGAGRHGGS